MSNQLAIVLLSVILIMGCSTTEIPHIIEADFDWLEGAWVRSNEVEGKMTYENWVQVEDGIYKGTGLTLLDIDTVFYEEMTIHNSDSTWVLEVSGPKDSITVFQITEFDDYGFKSFCPENDFPTIISYFVDGENLKAVISDGKVEVEFDFRPMKSNN